LLCKSHRASGGRNEPTLLRSAPNGGLFWNIGHDNYPAAQVTLERLRAADPEYTSAEVRAALSYRTNLMPRCTNTRHW
jgi:hypothetical protein